MTIRRALYDGYFTAKCHELPRFVTYKREYKKRTIIIDNISANRFGRTYQDYLTEVKKAGTANVFQYDSVIGKKTDRIAILTVTHAETRFQFGLLVKRVLQHQLTNQLINSKKNLEIYFMKSLKLIYVIMVASLIIFQILKRIKTVNQDARLFTPVLIGQTIKLNAKEITNI